MLAGVGVEREEGKEERVKLIKLPHQRVSEETKKWWGKWR